MAEGKTITIIQKGRIIPQIKVNLEAVFVTNCSECNPDIVEYWMGFKILNTPEEIELLRTVVINMYFTWNWARGYDGGYEEESNYPIGKRMDGSDQYCSSKLSRDATVTITGNKACRSIVNLKATPEIITSADIVLGAFKTTSLQGDCTHPIIYPSLDSNIGEN